VDAERLEQVGVGRPPVVGAPRVPARDGQKPVGFACQKRLLRGAGGAGYIVHVGHRASSRKGER